MSKKMKVVTAVLAAVILLGVWGAVTVTAQEEPEPAPPAGGRGLMARVAEILNLPQEDLVSAFKQARQEMQPEQVVRIRERWENRQDLWPETIPDVFLRLVDKAEEKGFINPEEAEEIKAWWEQRPEALNRLLPRAYNLSAISGRRAIAAPDILLKHLEKAVKQERITPEEVEAIKAWWQPRPEALSRLLPRPRISPALRGRQMMAVPKGWHGSRPPEPAG